MNSTTLDMGGLHGAFGLSAITGNHANSQPGIWDVLSDSTGSVRSLTAWSRHGKSGSGYSRLEEIIQGGTMIAPRAITSVDVPRALAVIRQSLGLSTVEMAKIFAVSRRAIYDWADGKVVKQCNRDRIAEIQEIADRVNAKIGSKLGSLVREPLEDRISLLELLSQEVLNTHAISCVIEQIATVLSKAAAESVPSAHELAQKYNLQPLPEQTYRRNIKSVARHARGPQ